MNTRKAIGYVFLGCGTISLVIAALLFISVMAALPQAPSFGQELSPVALSAFVPYLILATIAYVIGGVCFCTGQENRATPAIFPKKDLRKPDETFERLKKLEENDDKNLQIFVRSLNEIERKQSMASRTSLADDKKNKQRS